MRNDEKNPVQEGTKEPPLKEREEVKVVWMKRKGSERRQRRQGRMVLVAKVTLEIG